VLDSSNFNFQNFKKQNNGNPSIVKRLSMKNESPEIGGWSFQPDEYVGKRFCRDFGDRGKWYGTVIASSKKNFNQYKKYWLAIYDSGDHEDIDESTLLMGVQHSPEECVAGMNHDQKNRTYGGWHFEPDFYVNKRVRLKSKIGNLNGTIIAHMPRVPSSESLILIIYDDGSHKHYTQLQLKKFSAKFEYEKRTVGRITGNMKNSVELVKEKSDAGGNDDIADELNCGSRVRLTARKSTAEKFNITSFQSASPRYYKIGEDCPCVKIDKKSRQDGENIVEVPSNSATPHTNKREWPMQDEAQPYIKESTDDGVKRAIDAQNTDISTVVLPELSSIVDGMEDIIESENSGSGSVIDEARTSVGRIEGQLEEGMEDDRPKKKISRRDSVTSSSADGSIVRNETEAREEESSCNAGDQGTASVLVGEMGTYDTSRQAASRDLESDVALLVGGKSLYDVLDVNGQSLAPPRMHRKAAGASPWDHRPTEVSAQLITRVTVTVMIS